MSLRLNGSYISKAHTILASSAFVTALFLGLSLHYRKIVKNEVAGYPQEWFPSVSATIGDWYPERSVFQIFIALTSGPRIALVFCWWWLTRSTTPKISRLVAFSGICRTFACGGWVYITSIDDHDSHDILMISYMVLTLPWMIGSIMSTPTANSGSRRRRKYVASSFFLAIIPMVYLFIQHKVYRVPGAYTLYSFFEWYLILSDIWFDSITAIDFAVLEITISSPAASRHKILSETTKNQTAPAVIEKSHVDLVASFPSDKQNYAYAYRLPFLPSSLFKFWRNLATFAADVYLAYVWWSIFTSLAVTVFYFSVWKLALAGQEAFLLSTLSPVLLRVSSIRRILESHKSRTWLHGLSIIGLLAYKAEDPLLRLYAVGFANMAGALLKSIEWSDEMQADRNGLVLAFGLCISSLSKFMNDSNNPIWPIVNERSGGWNKMGISAAVLATLEYGTRDMSDVILRSKTITEREKSTPIMSHKNVLDHWLFTAVSLGGLIFSLHCFLADSGTIVAWTWTGYPVKGPVPGYHGQFTLMAMALGIILASSATDFVRHPSWLTFGALSASLFYHLRNWPGFLAGLCFAIFLCSIIPNIIRNAARHGKLYPGKLFFTSWLFVCFLDFASTWTVAYAFVPAGWLLRERTDIILAMQMIPICFGLFQSWRATGYTARIPSTLKPSFRRRARQLSVSIILASLIYAGSRIPPKTPSSHKPASRVITAGIWTVHFGIDNAGRDSQRRMRDLIKDMELDVVGLLETDLHRVVFGNRDLTQLIAQDLGYYVDVGPGPNSHTWGAVLLSKFPIIHSTHHLLPSPHGELAPAISAVLDVWGTNVTVVVAHNGQEQDPLDRELQSTELARIMAATYPEPVIFLGYLVTTPLAKRPDPYEILVSDGMMHDIDEDDWDRWCEYILYRGLYRVAYARVSRSTITDTELQVGKFLVPNKAHPIVNASREDRYLRIYRETLPGAVWFPDEYLGNEEEGGKNGHYYHVHLWPLYYKLPENAVV